MKLFSDMTPSEKLEHCRRCIASAYEHLQAEHGPVHLADILDVWDYWTPYLLDRLTTLEAVLEAAKKLAPLVARSTVEWLALDEAIRAADAAAEQARRGGAR